MITFTATFGSSPVVIPVDIGLTTNDVVVVLGTTPVANPGLQIVSPTAGISFISHTPLVSGVYTYFISEAPSTFLAVARVEVVEKDIYSYLETLEDVAIGSWTWDKKEGLLTLLKKNGSTLGTYRVEDTSTQAYRERI